MDEKASLLNGAVPEGDNHRFRKVQKEVGDGSELIEDGLNTRRRGKKIGDNHSSIISKGTEDLEGKLGRDTP